MGTYANPTLLIPIPDKLMDMHMVNGQGNNYRRMKGKEQRGKEMSFPIDKK
jgi:hypothetical protein